MKTCIYFFLESNELGEKRAGNGAPRQLIEGKQKQKVYERRDRMYNSPKAELLYPETEAVLSDVIGISQEQNDNDFNITDLL